MAYDDVRSDPAIAALAARTAIIEAAPVLTQANLLPILGFTLPQITGAVAAGSLGITKLGAGLAVAGDGTLNVNAQVPAAAASVPALSAMTILLADGTTITGAQLQTALGSTPAAAPVATTINNATDAADGRTVTLTFNQPVSIATVGAIGFSIAGVAVPVTWNAPTTVGTTQVGVLATAATSGQSVAYTTSATAFTSPALAAVASGVAITNNSTVAAAAPTSGNGPALVMTNAVYDTTTAKFGQALASGSGRVTTNGAAGSRTIECWFKASAIPTVATQLILDTTAGSGGISIDPTGKAMIATFNYNQPGGGNVCDNLWHHLAIVTDTGSGTNNLYVDGVNGNSNNYGFSAIGPSVTYDVSASGSFTASNGGARNGFGELDEIRISSSARYTANFTPPTAPFVWDASSLALYHLDGSGASA